MRLHLLAPALLGTAANVHAQTIDDSLPPGATSTKPSSALGPAQHGQAWAVLVLRPSRTATAGPMALIPRGKFVAKNCSPSSPAASPTSRTTRTSSRLRQRLAGAARPFDMLGVLAGRSMRRSRAPASRGVCPPAGSSTTLTASLSVWRRSPPPRRHLLHRAGVARREVPGILFTAAPRAMRTITGLAVNRRGAPAACGRAASATPWGSRGGVDGVLRTCFAALKTGRRSTMSEKAGFMGDYEAKDFMPMSEKAPNHPTAYYPPMRGARVARVLRNSDQPRAFSRSPSPDGSRFASAPRAPRPFECAGRSAGRGLEDGPICRADQRRASSDLFTADKQIIGIC